MLFLGALSTSEIYTTSTTASRVDIGSLGSGPTFSSIPLSTTHRFNRNSISRRVYVADNPQRFCLSGSELRRYSDYTFDTGSLTDGIPSGAAQSIIASNVSTPGQVFSLSSGSEDRGTGIVVLLNFTQGSNQINLEQQILVRNVP